MVDIVEMLSKRFPTKKTLANFSRRWTDRGSIRQNQAEWINWARPRKRLSVLMPLYRAHESGKSIHWPLTEGLEGPGFFSPSPAMHLGTYTFLWLHVCFGARLWDLQTGSQRVVIKPPHLMEPIVGHRQTVLGPQLAVA